MIIEPRMPSNLLEKIVEQEGEREMEISVILDL